MSRPTVYVYTISNDNPVGGVKKQYRFVDILNKNGVDACVVHHQRGFRCTWFQNDTRVQYFSEIELRPTDILVVPEIFGPDMADVGPGFKKVILNQNPFMTFEGFTCDVSDRRNPYSHPDTLAAIVVSEHSQRYLQHAFVGLHVFRMRYSVDPNLFYFQRDKRRCISFMPRRNMRDAVQILNMLKFRGVLEGFELRRLEGMGEAQAAAALRESLVFMSLGMREGFGLPPAEAMACGCITVGYHGEGGREFLKPEFAYPIPACNIIEFAQTLEAVCRQIQTDPAELDRKRELASEFILSVYSPDHEEEDVVRAWAAIEQLR